MASGSSVGLMVYWWPWWTQSASGELDRLSWTQRTSGGLLVYSKTFGGLKGLLVNFSYTTTDGLKRMEMRQLGERRAFYFESMMGRQTDAHQIANISCSYIEMPLKNVKFISSNTLTFDTRTYGRNG